MTDTAAARPVENVELRAPDTVMRLERLGSFFPTRLSFMRVLLRRLAGQRAQVKRPIWDMDEDGFGHAVYSIDIDDHTYSLVAFSNALAEDARTDRVIAEAWDAAFVLFDGVPESGDIARLKANAPRQEAGRFDARDLILSRANKSVRLFEHVVESLARGARPDDEKIAATSYLMRTTAVYGNGKFGIADRAHIQGRSGLSGPFAAEMLTVWLIRGFTHDLVEHIAACRSPLSAAKLDLETRKHLGVGNSTGLGMAPFLVNHPGLLNNWIEAREVALARVRSLPGVDEPVAKKLSELATRTARHLDEWQTQDVDQKQRIAVLRREWGELGCFRNPVWWRKEASFDAALKMVVGFSPECQELTVALVLEPHGDLVDDLAGSMVYDTDLPFQPAMRTERLRDLLRQAYGWALGYDFADPAESHWFWYVSEEKLEPRLGERFEEPGAEREMPLDIARQIQALYGDLETAEDESVATFLMRHPQHRFICRRVQAMADRRYGEIRDNLIARTCRPIDMLRCKLSFFGASKFDPKSDLWTRITLFAGAPLFSDVAGGEDCDDWWLPAIKTA